MAPGAFTQDSTPTDDAIKDKDANQGGTGQEQENGYPTDVDGVHADDVVKQGKEEFYLFDVDPEEFYSNMGSDRKKLRFKSSSNVTQYKNKTKNSLRPFYIRTQDKNGQSFTRKIR